MEPINRKKHWENIYDTKNLQDVSWYQPTPETSLTFFAEHNIPLDAKIIDIGGGDSYLVDHLIKMGYTDITVLDISEKAINKAKKRLGNLSEKVNWIVSDIIEFRSTKKYDFWHDRTAFHFLTDQHDTESYVKLAEQSIESDGYLILGTFSENGPTKCSGIPIHQYSESSMVSTFSNEFNKIRCFQEDHPTPFGTSQNFLFCSFQRK